MKETFHIIHSIAEDTTFLIRTMRKSIQHIFFLDVQILLYIVFSIFIPPPSLLFVCICLRQSLFVSVSCVCFVFCFVFVFVLFVLFFVLFCLLFILFISVLFFDVFPFLLSLVCLCVCLLFYFVFYYFGDGVWTAIAIFPL